MAIAVSACTSAGPGAPAPTVRVIARFGPSVLDPLDPAFLARLADLSHVTRIDPIRPMSGNAYVLLVACADPHASSPGGDVCGAALARLRRSDAVVDVEVDARATHQ